VGVGGTSGFTQPKLRGRTEHLHQFSVVFAHYFVQFYDLLQVFATVLSHYLDKCGT